MAQTIKLKRSATQNAVPSTSSLALGELAINTYDGKLFIKKNVSGTESIVTIGEVGAGSIGPTELASTAVTAGSYGSTSAIPVITIDADGRITSASTATISGLSADSVTATEIAANAVGISELNVSDGTDGQVLTTDGNGNLAFEDQSGGAASATAFSTNIASGDGTTTAFTLSESPSAESKIIAFINGVFQNQDAYTISGTTLTFDTAPISGTNNVVVYVIGDVYSGESVLISNFSGNGTTTAFTLANNPGNENNTQVYIDGVYQQKTTYSVSGTTLTFSSAPPTGTNNIEVVMLTSTTVNTPAAGSVVTASMADDSVTASKIVSSAVTTAKIADSNVTTAKIADDAVTIGKIADAALVIESEGISSNDNDTTLPTSAAVKDYVDTQVAGKDALSELSGDTDDVTEGSTNLYYTDARVGTYISGNRTYGNITTTGYLAGPSTFTIDPAAVGDNTGTLVIAGNLQVDGTTTTVNSTTLTVDDKLVTLGSGSANAGAANGAGIEVDITGSTNPSLTYDGTNDRWDLNKDISADNGLFFSSQDFYLYRSAADIASLRVGDSGSYKFFQFTDTGTVARFSSASGSVSLGSGANDHLLIDSSGNVGIGTDSPSSTKKLHVYSGDSGASDYGVPGLAIENDTNVSLQFMGGASHQLGITFSDPGTAEAGYIYYNTGTNDLEIKVEDDVVFKSGNTETVRIDSSGNFGILTGNQGTQYQRLHVGGSGASIYLGNNSADTNFIHTGGCLALTADTDVYITADSNETSASPTGGAIVFGGGSNTNTDSNLDFTEAEFGNNGAARVEYGRFHTNGFFGLNTTPGVELDLKRKTNAYPFRIGSETGQGRAMVFADVASTPTKYNWLVGSQYNIDNSFEITPSTAVGGYTFSTPGISIKQDGKVGIGTINPQDKLHVYDGDIGIESSSGKRYRLIAETNGGFTIRDQNASASRLAIDTSGNVGIGTQSPASLISSGSSPILSIGGTDGGLTTGEKAGTISFITSDASYTNTYSDGITGEIASIATSSTGAAYGLAFYTGTITSSDRGERLRIRHDGNVGIGTDNPLAKLHVREGDSGQGTINSNFDQLCLEDDLHAGMTILSGASSDGAIYFGDVNSNDVGQIKYKHNGDDMAFTQSGAETLVLSNDGAYFKAVDSYTLTINADTDNSDETGVPTLDFKMDGSQTRLKMGVAQDNNPYISTESDIALPLIIKTGTSGQNRVYINDTGMQISDGTAAAPDHMLQLVHEGTPVDDRTFISIVNGSGSGDISSPESHIDFEFFDSNTNQFPQARITAGTGTNPGVDANTQNLEGSGYIALATSPGSGTSGEVDPTNRLVVDSQGRVLIGTTSSNLTYGKLQVAAGGETAGHGGIIGFFDTDASVGSSNLIQLLSFSGDTDATGGQFIRFRDNNSVMGSVSAANGTQVSYGVSSDERLKENIVDASSQLELVKDIKVREFDWKVNGYHEVGMIAQELNEIIPNVVQEGGDDITEQPWTVDYGKLTPYLIKAIQEQQTIIDDLKSRLDEAGL